MRVVVGQYDLEKEDREEMTFNIEDVHLHHKWNNKKDKQDVRHDIALIKIRRKGDGTGIEVMGKSGFVRPACLPVQGNILEKDSCEKCQEVETIQHVFLQFTGVYDFVLTCKHHL